MAATSASRSWATFARRAAVTGAVAAVGLIGLAIPASAHKPWADAGCDKENVPTVTVSAVAYELKGDNATSNWIKIFIDGSDKPEIEKDFGVNFPATAFAFKELDATAAHTFKVVVKAWNDDDFKDKTPDYSRIFELKTKACKEKENPPANPPADTPANPAPQPQPAPQPAPAPAVSNAGLADTGVSIAIPIAVGAVLLVGGGVLLLMMRRRGKA